MSPRVLLLVTALLASLGAVGEASAHPAGTASTRSAPSPANEPSSHGTALPPGASPADFDATALLVTALVVMGIVQIVPARRSSARFVALSLLLIFSGFEGAMHSAHHLDGASDPCQVASSAEHLNIVEVDAPSTVSTPTLMIGAPSPEQPLWVRLADRTPRAGRAPPI